MREQDDIFGAARFFSLEAGEKSGIWSAVTSYMTDHPVQRNSFSVRDNDLLRHNTHMDVLIASMEKCTQKFRLTDAERKEGYESVMAFVRSHPIASREDSQSFLFSFSPLFRSTVLICAVLFLVIGAGGTLSVSAEGSLPGEMLYPMKIYVNEGMKLLLTFSNGKKALWESRRLSRRLEEAERLAAIGSLHPDLEQNLMHAIDDHTSRVRARITNLANADDTEALNSASLELETSLKAHSSILSKLAKERGGNRAQIRGMLARVKRDADDITRVRLHAESKILSDGISAKKRGKAESRGLVAFVDMKGVEGKITRARVLLNDERLNTGRENGVVLEEGAESLASEMASDGGVEMMFAAKMVMEPEPAPTPLSDIDQAEERLGVAERMMEDAKARFENQEHGSALAALRTSLRAAEEARLLTMITAERRKKASEEDGN